MGHTGHIHTKKVLLRTVHCTKVRFASILSGRFITVIVLNPPEKNLVKHISVHCTEVRFACFISGRFTTMAVINPHERKLTKRTFVHSGDDDSVMDVCDFSNNKAAMKTVIKVSSTNNKTAGDGRGGSGSEASPRDSGNGSAFSDISMTSATSASRSTIRARPR